MNKNAVQHSNAEHIGYQVLIANIKWSSTSTRQYATKHNYHSELPDAFTLDLPENVLNQARKPHNVFNDIVESFCYNFLTNKFGYEVNFCQIWLPFDN